MIVPRYKVDKPTKLQKVVKSLGLNFSLNLSFSLAIPLLVGLFLSEDSVNILLSKFSNVSNSLLSEDNSRSWNSGSKDKLCSICSISSVVNETLLGLTLLSNLRIIKQL